MNTNSRQRSGRSSGGRKRWEPNRPRGNPNSGNPNSGGSNASSNARRNYERYLALAEAQVQAGDVVGAENYYQYAEHYLRSMSPDTETA
jgi:hypothetical protein